MVESIAELRRICQSIDKKKGKLPLSVVFARKFSIYFTKLLLYTKITANQVTLLCIIIGVLGALVIAVGSPLMIFVGALLLELFYIFDHVDGEVARYRGTSSTTGVYLDFIGHYIVHPAMFVCLAYGSYSASSAGFLFIFGYLSALAIILIDLSRDCIYKTAFLIATSREYERTEAKSDSTLDNDRSQIPKDKQSTQREPSEASMFAVSLFRVPLVLHVILLVAAINLVIPQFIIGSFSLNTIQIFLAIYAVLSTIIWIGMIIYYKKIGLAEKLVALLSEKKSLIKNEKK